MATASPLKKERARRHFDRWSTRYEEDRTSRWLAALQEEALRALELTPADRLLDVGCGTGAAVRQAAPLIERAVGVDLSEGMVSRARELAADLPNAEFQEGDSERLPFADGAFTAVLCTTSFHHYPDPRRAIAEMARVLAPGGTVVIGDGCSDRLATRMLDLGLRTFQRSHVRFYRSRELQSLFVDGGVTPQSQRLLFKGGYLIATARKRRVESPAAALS